MHPPPWSPIQDAKAQPVLKPNAFSAQVRVHMHSLPLSGLEDSLVWDGLPPWSSVSRSGAHKFETGITTNLVVRTPWDGRGKACADAT